MSATAKIDFEPGLFDEGQPEAASDLPTIQPKRRTNRAPFIVAGGLLLVLAVAFFALNTTSKPKSIPATPVNYIQICELGLDSPSAMWHLIHQILRVNNKKICK